MDAEGGCVVHRDRRTSKLAVVVAMQNMVVTACLLVTLYVYWDVKVKQERDTVSDHTVHILLKTIVDIQGGQKLKFDSIDSSRMMNLTDDTNNIFVSCPGPYVLHMDVCFINMTSPRGTLELHVEGNNAPLTIFELYTAKEDCRGLYNTVYLKKAAQAFLYLNSTKGFKIKNITMGLSYMLHHTICD